jgi:predicted Rossmann fold nucleotide-binding protein DprA/Smf involved in DNA uptake
MKTENKILLSLLPYSVERKKLRMLKNNASYFEIMKEIKLHGLRNIDERISSIKEFNTCFVDEARYPSNLLNCDLPPMRLQSNGNFPINGRIKFGVVGSSDASQKIIKSLRTFVQAILKTDSEIVGTGNGVIYKTVELCDGYNRDRSFIFLGCGLMRVQHLRYDCSSTLLSPFEPFEVASKRNFLSMYEIFGSLCNSVIIFQCSNNDDIKRSVTPILDSGKGLYVHRDGVTLDRGCEKSFSLYLEGCEMVDKFDEVVQDEGFIYNIYEKKHK